MAAKFENAGAESEDSKLSDIFEEIWKTYQILEESKEPTNSENNQLALARVVKKCEAAIDMVNILSLFSSNEAIEEVATNEIKFMLLSALLGYFTMKRSSNPSTRLAIVTKSKAYYKDYMRLCSQYSLTPHSRAHSEDSSDDHSPTSPTAARLHEGPPDMQTMAHTRAEKIKQFKQAQEDESKLRDLHTAVNREHVDDEVKREYYLALVKKFIRLSIDDLDCIKTEIEMLQIMSQRTGQPPPPPRDKPNKITRPFILTKNEIQKQVFGAGYPSIHSMTIEEFYQQKVDEGTFSSNTGPSSLQGMAADPTKVKLDKEREREEEEGKEDRDDEETLARQRAWDDWRDENRRGDGNRQNMG